MCCCDDKHKDNPAYHKARCAAGCSLSIDIIVVIVTIWVGIVLAVATGLATARISWYSSYFSSGDACDNAPDGKADACKAYWSGLESISSLGGTLLTLNYVVYLFGITGIVFSSLISCVCQCCCSGPQQLHKTGGIYQVVSSIFSLIMAVLYWIFFGVVSGTAAAGKELIGDNNSILCLDCNMVEALQSLSTPIIIVGVWSIVVTGCRGWAAFELMRSSKIEYVGGEGVPTAEKVVPAP